MKVEIGDQVFYRGFNRGGAQDDRGLENLGQPSAKVGDAERKKSGGGDRVNKAP